MSSSSLTGLEWSFPASGAFGKHKRDPVDCVGNTGTLIVGSGLELQPLDFLRLAHFFLPQNHSLDFVTSKEVMALIGLLMSFCGTSEKTMPVNHNEFILGRDVTKADLALV